MLSIRLFGVPRVQILDRQVSAFPTDRCMDLLALLVLARGEQVPKSLLIQNIWPNKGENDCTNRFNVTLSLIRKTLGESFENIVGSERSGLRLKTGVESDWIIFWCRVQEFHHTENNREKLKLSKQIWQLYHLPFMPDSTHQWAEIARAEAENAWKDVMSWRALATNDDALELRVKGHITFGIQSGGGPR